MPGYNRGNEDDPNSSSGGSCGTYPLHVINEAETQAGIYRLTCKQHSRPKSTNYGYHKKSRDKGREPILPIMTDEMIPRCACYKPFDVQLCNKHEWQNGFKSDNERGLVRYTDVPKTSECTCVLCVLRLKYLTLTLYFWTRYAVWYNGDS